jgi:hypothetical protein
MKFKNSDCDLNKSFGQQSSQSPVTKINGHVILSNAVDIKWVKADPQIYTVFPGFILEKSYPTT